MRTIIIVIVNFSCRIPVFGAWLLDMFLRATNAFYRLSSVAAISVYGHHPKHEIIKYEQWFKKNMVQNGRVLDIGSNTGRLSACLSDSASEVIGVEIDRAMYKRALKYSSKNNIRFICGDILDCVDKIGKFQTIIMSNVLEHIENRRDLLKKIHGVFDDAKESRLLIRVPQFDRDWLTPLKQQRGIEWRSDPTHVVEYTFASLHGELAEAGFEISGREFSYGEIYVIAVRLGSAQ